MTMNIEDHKEARARGRLSFIRPGASRTATYDPRRSRRIAWLRLALPGAAFALLLLLFVWPVIAPNHIKSVGLKHIPDLVIKNLHFTGLDSKSEPYSLTAVKATRPGNAQNIYDLEKPEGEITLQNGSWIAGNSQYGRYDADARQLWLGGDVQLFHDKGYQFTTDEAQVDLNDNNAWGGKPVLIQGNFGEIKGQGFRLLNGGKTLVVTGPAKALLNLHPAASSDKPGPSVP